MLNIISHQADASIRRGPYKVFRNLIKGLDVLKYPYVVNGAFSVAKRVWVHDNHHAYEYLRKSRGYTIAGPNLFSVPEEVSGEIFDNLNFVVPSPWLYNVWTKRGFDQKSLLLCPSGVDTEEYHPGLLKKNRDYVLVYYKKRDLSGLSKICNLLGALRIPFQLCLYGSYTEPEYKELLSGARFCIWYGCHETQGIGMLETLAAGIPVLVSDDYDYRQDGRTAAPYFSSCCGEIGVSFQELKVSLRQMLDQWKSYDPRQYVVENLGLERQALAFIELWGKWGLTLEGGRSESLLSEKRWKVPARIKTYFRVKK